MMTKEEKIRKTYSEEIIRKAYSKGLWLGFLMGLVLGIFGTLACVIKPLL